MVRKTVTPSSPARRATSSQSAVRLCTSRPGGGLVEEEDAGVVDQRQGEVEPPAHAAGVAADLAIGRLGEADALDQLVAAAQRLVLRDPVHPRLQSHVLACGQERIERRLLQRDADLHRERRGPA